MRISDCSSDVCSSYLRGVLTVHPVVALRSHAGATRKGRASSHPGCILRRMRCQEATPALLEACEGSQHRTAERRVGKECVSTCSSRLLPKHKKQHIYQ